jgi:hypothetical protein
MDPTTSTTPKSMAAATPIQDAELERYRTLLDVPSEFKDGFGWTTLVGIFFCGLIMMPGGIYLSLMTGTSIGAAAQWVTVILFMEIARRALKPLSRQNLVTLLHAAWVMMAANVLFPGGPMGELVFRAYLVSSEAARDAGLLGLFPTWFAPPHDSPAITERNLFHIDWLVPISVAFGLALLSLVKKYTLGYFFFRVTSDIERLPFPLAPISAQGAMALAESDESKDEPTAGSAKDEAGPLDKKGARWRIFSLGACLGIAFGLLQVGIPSVTSLFLAKPFYLIPQPFLDTTTATEGFLPATPTGISINIAVIILGFVLPFWSVVGTFIAVLLTILINPVLHHFGILQTWQPGMNTVNTTFANNIDFWLSFNIGAGFGIAAVSIYSLTRDLRKKIAESRAARTESGSRPDLWAPPRAGRGDYPIWIALALYALASCLIVALTMTLLGWRWNIFFFMVFFVFLYNPFISYVNARLLGIAGQNVNIPYIKELGFLASGAQGIDIWLAPVPVENFGYMAQNYRVNELTGVSFWSLAKADLVALPILFVLSMVFWGFIWKSDPVPSEIFPAAQVNWELHAKNSVLLYSSTMVDENGNRLPFAETEFGRAFKPETVGVGFAVVTLLYTVLNALGLPVMLLYGIMRGLGDLPHNMILEIVGALASRFYFQKKYGETNFLRAAPTLMAGYLTGVGLIGMATIALRLINSAVSSAPF